MTSNVPPPPQKARDMEVGQIERVGADGHVRFDYEDLGDEPVYLGAESASATEHRLTEAEADEMLSRTADASRGGTESAGGPVETITVGPEGAPFPGPPAQAPPTTDAHDNDAETRLVQVRYPDDTCEWEAWCVEPCIPGTASLVCASEKGPLDALHQLKASLAMLGLPCRPYVTNIGRVAHALDD